VQKVYLENKLRIHTLQEQKHDATTIVVDYYVRGAMLEAYHKLKKKWSTTAELCTTLKKIWNKVPQKPVAKAVQNFCKHLQVCMNKAGKYTEHFTGHILYRFIGRNLVSEQFFKYW